MEVLLGHTFLYVDLSIRTFLTSFSRNLFISCSENLFSDKDLETEKIIKWVLKKLLALKWEKRAQIGPQNRVFLGFLRILCLHIAESSHN